MDELARLAALVESSGSILLDIALSEELPGYVRSVVLRRGNRVAVEFDKYAHDEGGVYFVTDYPSLSAAVSALEAFLRNPLHSWRNREEDYPELPESVPSLSARDSHDMVADALRRGRIKLPGGATYRLGSAYWGQFWRG